MERASDRNSREDGRVTEQDAGAKSNHNRGRMLACVMRTAASHGLGRQGPARPADYRRSRSDDRRTLWARYGAGRHATKRRLGVRTTMSVIMQSIRHNSSARLILQSPAPSPSTPPTPPSSLLLLLLSSVSSPALRLRERPMTTQQRHDGG